MKDAALAAVSALALFEALRLMTAGRDLLRLRQMAHVSAALAGVCAPMGATPALAAFLAAAACGLRPDFRNQPAPALMLLMLTPAAGFCLVHTALWGWTWPLAPDADGSAAGAVCALGALTFALLLAPAFGFGWRFRLAAAAATTWAGLAALVFLAGGDASGALAAAPSVLAAFVLAFRASDIRAAVRFSVGGAAVFAAPLLVFAAQAGPWTQAPGDELVIVRAPLEPSGDGAYGVQTYSESGLAEGYTIVAAGFQEVSGRASRAGGMLGLRAEIWRDDAWILSGEAAAGLEPFSFNAGSAGWERHAQADLSLLAGWSGALEGAPVYASVGLGWRIRPDEFGDAAVLSVSAGIDLATDLQANLHASAAFERGQDRAFGQASLLWRLDETVALEAGVQSFTDRDGDMGAQAFAGVWLRF